MSYLKNKTTGEVYPFNKDMFKRGDMLPCTLDGTLIEDAPAEPDSKPARKPRAKKATVVEDEPEVDVVIDDFDLGDD